MPLPKPPAKRADLLSRDAYDTPAASASAKRTRRERPAAEPVPVLPSVSVPMFVMGCVMRPLSRPTRGPTL